jgi:hypothetical protein
VNRSNKFSPPYLSVLALVLAASWDATAPGTSIHYFGFSVPLDENLRFVDDGERPVYRGRFPR